MSKKDGVGSVNKNLNVNVILTFSTCNSYGEKQEIFDLSIPIGGRVVSAANFLDKNLFGLIVKKCKELGRIAEDLIKISTASNWSEFELYTNLKSIYSLGHSCKWYFSREWKVLDAWEECLVEKYGFGTHT